MNDLLRILLGRARNPKDINLPPQDVELPNQSGTSDLYRMPPIMGRSDTPIRGTTASGGAHEMGPNGLTIRGNLHPQPTGFSPVPEGAVDRQLLLRLMQEQMRHYSDGSVVPQPPVK